MPVRTATNSRSRLVALFAVVVAYLLLFGPIEHAWGSVALATSAVPIIVAGLLLGLRAGIGVALLSVPVNAALFHLVEAADWGMAIEQAAVRA